MNALTDATLTAAQAVRNIGLVADCRSPITATHQVTFDKLAGWFAVPKNGAKDGRGWVPADIAEGPRKAERVETISFLVLDVEAAAEAVKGETGEPLRAPNGDTTKKVIGPEAPPVDDMTAELALHGWRCILHTSYSHGGPILPEGVAHPRYRLIFDLSRPLTPAELKPLGMHVAAVLGIADCFDSKCLDPARLFFAPRCPTPERMALFRHGVTEGEPLPVDDLLQAAHQAQAAHRAAQDRKPPPASASVIDAFNDRHDCGAILESCGYAPRRGGRWLFPGSTSGIPGVRLLPSDGRGARVFSDHGGDPLSDGHAHDAFDCFCTLKHGGDVREAVKSAALMMGVDRAPVARSTAATADHQGGTPDADYPPPLPLPKLPPVPEFPLELLPDDLVAWVGDAAERARFRPDFAAAASMVALGSVIGRKLGIRLKQRDDWTEYANVWGGLIGPPSALKSPAMRAAMRPFKALQAAADERHAKEREEYEAQMEAFKLRRDAKKKAAVKALSQDSAAGIDLGDAEAPPAPVPMAYWTSNVNEASLGVLLEQNPNGLLIERDELSSLLVNLENEQNSDLRGMMLSGWSGNEGYRFDRIMRGTTTLPKFALSVVGGIQPGPLARYVRSAFSGERADGLLQRFQLIVWPDPEGFEYIDRWPDGDARKTAAALFERADKLDADTIGSRADFGNDPPFVRLSEAAQGLFIEWYSAFMRERRAAESGGESAPLAAHFGKFPGLVGKLALILHVADDSSPEVSERTMLKALAWLDYLTPHARRVYHAVEHPETGAAEMLLSRLKRGELPEFFKAWEITRKNWHGLGEREAVKKACRLLFEYGWLIEIDAGGLSGGRPNDPIYSVSPSAKVTP